MACYEPQVLCTSFGRLVPQGRTPTSKREIGDIQNGVTVFVCCKAKQAGKRFTVRAEFDLKSPTPAACRANLESTWKKLSTQ